MAISISNNILTYTIGTDEYIYDLKQFPEIDLSKSASGIVVLLGPTKTRSKIEGLDSDDIDDLKNAWTDISEYIATPTIETPFAGFLETSGGVSDMAVDGSSTSVEYFLDADADADIYMKEMHVVIVDNNIRLSKFGNISALSNGITIKFINPDASETIIAGPIQSLGDFLFYGPVGWGSNTTSFEAGDVNTSSHYAGFYTFDLTKYIEDGIRIPAGDATSKLIVTIEDDLSNLTEFKIRVTGFKSE